MAPPSGIDVALKSGSGGSATAEYSSKDSVQIQTQYLYDNDPRIEFTSDYGYHAEIRTESLGTFVPVSVVVK